MKNRSKAFGFLAALAIVAILILYNSYLGSFSQPKNNSEKIPEVAILAKTTGSAQIFLPAVDSEGNGTLARLEVRASPGDGKTLANIENLLFFVDTQFSIQTAREVAANITGVEISKYNLIYDIDLNDSKSKVLVEGPSAGAALAVATVAAIENKKLPSDVMITGTIDPDGTIGRVGGIAEKAKIAKLAGVKTFLVPEGQGFQKTYRPVKQCEQVGGFRLCTTEYKLEQFAKPSENGLAVIEVSNVREALKYFLQ